MKRILYRRSDSTKLISLIISNFRCSSCSLLSPIFFFFDLDNIVLCQIESLIPYEWLCHLWEIMYEINWNMNFLILSRPDCRKTLWTRGAGGHYAPPPSFFSLKVTKSLKLSLGTFLALQTTWKDILDNFRFRSLAAKGWQISMGVLVGKFKISIILSFNGAMHLKIKLRKCTSSIKLEEIGFVSKKKILIFSDFA